jgi:glycosyltransferase involved in cell wall biosynthesis
MSNDQLASVIIPTYNRADVVCRAIDSVLGQTYTNHEVIVVDDGSTDETQSKLRGYGDRIRVLTQENSGPSKARNRGIATACGEVIAFLDSDDYWLPTKLERQMELLDRVGTSVVCCLCNCTILYNNGIRSSTFKVADILPSCSRGLWLNPAAILSTRFVIFNQAAAIRREALDRSGHFDENLRFGEDYELPLRLALEGPWAVIGDELVVCRDAGPGSWGQKALAEEIRLRQDLLQMRKQISELIERDDRHRGLRNVARRELRRARRELTIAHLMRHHFPVTAALGRFLRLVERLRRAIFRRSPLFPRMEIARLN